MRNLILICLIFAIGFITGCSKSQSVSKTEQNANYRVHLNLDGTSLGQRTIVIKVSDLKDAVLPVESVSVIPSMPDMNMFSPEVATTMTNPGEYQARSELFSMLGKWDLGVKIRANGKDDVVTFTVDATP